MTFSQNMKSLQIAILLIIFCQKSIKVTSSKKRFLFLKLSVSVREGPAVKGAVWETTSWVHHVGKI